MSDRPHGYARYKLDGCRCYPCAAAAADYNDQRRRAIAYGRWHPWTDPEPARQHVRQLQTCGMGLRAIATAAGIDRKQLQTLTVGRPERATGPQQKIRPAIAAAILNVQPTLDTMAACTPIDATGTRRRLQALVAGGWPQQYLAAELGMTPGNFGAVLSRAQVIVRTARAARGLYDRLWNTDPTEYGATPVGVARTRKRAAALGWPPVGAWDDDNIDDPAAYPDWTGECGTLAGYRGHRRLGIPQCQPCRTANSQHAQEREVARRKGVAA